MTKIRKPQVPLSETMVPLNGPGVTRRKLLQCAAAGMGGLLTSCGEENLLRLEKDRYRGRDICQHEFAHNILENGVPDSIRDQVLPFSTLITEPTLAVSLSFEPGDGTSISTCSDTAPARRNWRT